MEDKAVTLIPSYCILRGSCTACCQVGNHTLGLEATPPMLLLLLIAALRTLLQLLWRVPVMQPTLEALEGV